MRRSAGAGAEALIQSTPELGRIPSKLLELIGRDDPLEGLSVDGHRARGAMGSVAGGRAFGEMTNCRRDNATVTISNQRQIHLYDIPPPCSLCHAPPKAMLVILT